jgi:hypothetical protein
VELVLVESIRIKTLPQLTVAKRVQLAKQQQALLSHVLTAQTGNFRIKDQRQRTTVRHVVLDSTQQVLRLLAQVVKRESFKS